MIINAKIQGSARAIVKRHGKVIIATDFVDNMILNSFFSQARTYNTLAVGTGTTAPAATDTSLQTQVASTTTSQVTGTVSVLGDNYILTKILTAVFDVGAVVANVAEAGLIHSGVAVTRVLFKDEAGNPVVIPVTAEDQLIVEYKLVASVPWKTVVTQDVEGVSTEFDIRFTSRLGVSSSEGNNPSTFFNLNYNYSSLFSKQSDDLVTLPAAINTVGTGYANATNGVKATVATMSAVYDPVGRKNTQKFFLSLTGTETFADNTVAGMIVSNSRFSGSTSYDTASAIMQMRVTPPIPKTNSFTLSLGFTMELSA